MGNDDLVNQLNNLARPTTAPGEYEEAESYLRETLRLVDKNATSVQESLLGIANLIGKRGQKERAAELLPLVLAEPRSASEIKQLATRFLAELQTELAPDVFVGAQERGKTLYFDTVVADLLANPIFPENANIDGRQHRG